MNKLQKKPAQIDSDASASELKKPGFGAYATTSMFVGLCAAYIGAYIGQAMPGGGSNYMPIFVAVTAAVCMAIFEFLVQKKKLLVLENFSLAASMLIAMAIAVATHPVTQRWSLLSLGQ